MSRVIEDVLAVWRDGERLLEELSPVDEDHETIARSVAELRQLYAHMTDVRETSQERLAAAERVVEASKATIERVRLRLEASASPDSDLSQVPALDLEGDPG